MSAESVIDELRIKNQQRHAKYEALYEKRLAKNLRLLETIPETHLKPCPVCNKKTYKTLDMCMECRHSKHLAKMAIRQQHGENYIRRKYSLP
jgi:hypothetical protein